MKDLSVWQDTSSLSSKTVKTGHLLDMDTIEKTYAMIQTRKTRSLSFWETVQEELHAKEEHEVSEKEVVGIQILPL